MYMIIHTLYNQYTYTLSMYIAHRSTDITSRRSKNQQLQAGDMDLGRFLQSQPRHRRGPAMAGDFDLDPILKVR